MLGAARSPVAVGAVFSVLTAVWDSVGSGRAFNYDPSGSIGRFIATPSLLDPFHRHDLYGNQVYFSFLDHVVYTVAGSRDEHVLRIVAIVAGAVAAGLLVWELGKAVRPGERVARWRRHGHQPMFMQQSSGARGYSLLVPGAVGSTICLFRLLDGRSRAAAVLYAMFLAGGIGTHLFMLMVLVVHVAAKRAPLRQWLERRAIAIVLDPRLHHRLAAHRARRGHRRRRPVAPSVGKSRRGRHRRHGPRGIAVRPV